MEGVTIDGTATFSGGETADLPLTLSSPELREATRRILEVCEQKLTQIARGSSPRTLEAVLEPINQVLLRISNLSNQGRVLFNVHPDPEVRAAGRGALEGADQFLNRMRVNVELFAAIRGIGLTDADPSTRFAAEKLLKEMRRAGVEKDPAKRARLRALNDEIDQLCNQFEANIANLPGTILFDDPKALEGLPEDYRMSHRPGPDGRIHISTAYPDVYPVMTFATNGEVRRQTLERFLNRAYPENVAVLQQILARRHEFAQLLGYPNFASYAIEDKMMGSVPAAHEFLSRLVEILRPLARSDAELFLNQKRADHSTANSLDPWDVTYFAGEGHYDAKTRMRLFGFDARFVREYFPYLRVRDGLFGLCQRLFRLSFTPVEPMGLWHPTVESFDVARDGTQIGRIFLDLTPRPGKFSHAAQLDIRTGIEGVQLPQAALVCNFLDPQAEPEAALMRYGDVVTFFHEFGHLLHCIFSGRQRWVYNQQAMVEWDFIEAPSQLLEEWARDPTTLSGFARHFQTHEPMPLELARRVAGAESIGRAFRWLHNVAAALVSLTYYERDPAALDPSKVFRDVFGQHTLIPPREEYHFECGWGHLTGYSALYYTYAWSLVIARDLLSPFLAKGSLADVELAERYLHQILAPGSSRPARDLIRGFLQRDFDFRAFEEWIRGRPPHGNGIAF
jgi:thimet oligopeptidase